MPFSPVQRARKFSQVTGVMSLNSSKTTRPTGTPPMAMSKKHRGRFLTPIFSPKIDHKGYANRLYSTYNKLKLTERKRYPDTQYLQGADDKLGQFLIQDILATANCLQHSLESCPSLL
jgi:hypothetical protein